MKTLVSILAALSVAGLVIWFLYRATHPSGRRQREFTPEELEMMGLSVGLRRDLCGASVSSEEAYANPSVIRDSIPLPEWPEVLRECDPRRVSRLYCSACSRKYLALVGKSQGGASTAGIMAASEDLADRHLALR
jgi:hypothetical protein